VRQLVVSARLAHGFLPLGRRMPFGVCRSNEPQFAVQQLQQIIKFFAGAMVLTGLAKSFNRLEVAADVDTRLRQQRLQDDSSGALQPTMLGWGHAQTEGLFEEADSHA